MKLYHVTENKIKLNKGSHCDKQRKRGDDGAHLCDNFRSSVLARSQDGWTCDARGPRHIIPQESTLTNVSVITKLYRN